MREGHEGVVHLRRWRRWRRGLLPFVLAFAGVVFVIAAAIRLVIH